MNHSSASPSPPTPVTTWPPAGHVIGQTFMIAACLHLNGTPGESPFLKHCIAQDLDEAITIAEKMAQLAHQSQLSIADAQRIRCVVMQITVTDSGVDVQFLHECPIAVGEIQS